VVLKDSNQNIEGELFYLEFNCAIPYQELSYEEINKTIVAKSRIFFKIINSSGTDSLLDTLFHTFTIPSFSEAAKEKLKFIIQFGLYIPEGRYEYLIEVSSGKDSGFIKNGLEVNRKDYWMSDLLLASEITRDTSGGYLTKGNLRVVPLPNHLFEEHHRNLFVYYEIYDILPDTGEIVVIYSIIDQNNKAVRKITRKLKKNFSTQAVNFGVNIESIPPENYIFRVEVFDSTLNISAKKEVPFAIKRTPPKEVVAEELPYYREIEYFLNNREYRHFSSLNERGKEIYLKKFWERHNYQEIAPRFEYADAHFGEGDRPGFKTDRGRIYVKFGPPDEIEKSTVGDEEAKPFEHWQYYNGLEFIFVDIRGTNEFVLIWTNAPGEKSQPVLFNYLPSSKRREIEK